MKNLVRISLFIHFGQGKKGKESDQRSAVSGQKKTNKDGEVVKHEARSWKARRLGC